MDIAKKYCVFLSEVGRENSPLVGGKGANLGEMVRAGLPVPPGFCVTTEAYREFTTQNQLAAYLADELAQVDEAQVSAVGRELRERMNQGKMPETVKAAILEALKETGESSSYAVRSSAVAEDLLYASFAGQQDTYLNIRGIDALLAKIQECWASLFTDRAILYRKLNQIPQEQVFMSVVVQHMVYSEAAGVMFTADPVTGHRGIISIDAGFGLGEALVSGLITPDIYKIRKADLEILEQKVAEKQLQIRPLEKGGVQKVELKGEKARAAVLSAPQIKELAKWGVALEDLYQVPQDVEWCFAEDQLYLVQTRAITSLFPLPEPQPQDAAFHVYFSLNHLQMMTDPISPLGIDMVRTLLAFDRGAQGAAEYKFLKSAAGRIYADISILLGDPQIGKFFPAFLKNVDHLVQAGVLSLMQRPDFQDQIYQDEPAIHSLKKFVKPLIRKALKRLVFQKPKEIIPQANAYILQRVQEAEATLAAAGTDLEKLHTLRRVLDFQEDFRYFLPRLAPALASFKLLGFLEEKWLGSQHFTNQIVQGLEGNVTTEMGLLTGDLADEIRKSPNLQAVFQHPDTQTLNQRINQVSGETEFKAKYADFMQHYGMRGPGEIDLARKRWQEDPTPLIQPILAMVATAEAQSHRRDYQAHIQKAERAIQDLVEAVKNQNGGIKAKVIKRVCLVVRNYLPIREHPKYLIIQLLNAAKKVFLAQGESFVQKGQLAEPKDVFYLSYWEVLEAIESGAAVLDLVKTRKESYTYYQKLNPPRVLTNFGEEVKVSPNLQDLPAGAFTGMGVSSGVVEGIAKVITDPGAGSVAKGEILVAPFTDPGWTPHFINAAGLITEVGGLLTHGSVVAREYGIPAVVGVVDATRNICTGQRIRVDGSAGLVCLLENKEQGGHEDAVND